MLVSYASADAGRNYLIALYVNIYTYKYCLLAETTLLLLGERTETESPDEAWRSHLRTLVIRGRCFWCDRAGKEVAKQTSNKIGVISNPSNIMLIKFTYYKILIYNIHTRYNVNENILMIDHFHPKWTICAWHHAKRI